MSAEKNNVKNLESYIFQIIIWVVLLILIVIRIFNFLSNANTWIWIVNYIGMGIACLNLFVNKCLYLRSTKNRKAKPFIGFTIFISLIICLCGVIVYKFQSSIYNQCINDVITLFALFFSLSQIVWDYLLDFIVVMLKK